MHRIISKYFLHDHHSKEFLCHVELGDEQSYCHFPHIFFSVAVDTINMCRSNLTQNPFLINKLQFFSFHSWDNTFTLSRSTLSLSQHSRAYDSYCWFIFALRSIGLDCYWLLRVTAITIAYVKIYRFVCIKNFGAKIPNRARPHTMFRTVRRCAIWTFATKNGTRHW